jgi:Domain of unknown function (DUF222)
MRQRLPRHLRVQRTALPVSVSSQSYDSNIYSTCLRAPSLAVLSALDRAVDDLLAADFSALSTREQIAVAGRIEQVSRRLPAAAQRLIAALTLTATPAELGNTVSRALADALRVTPTEAKNRVADAEALAPRRAFDGQPLDPILTHTAGAQAAGLIGTAHTRIIREFRTQNVQSCRRKPHRRRRSRRTRRT